MYSRHLDLGSNLRHGVLKALDLEGLQWKIHKTVVRHQMFRYGLTRHVMVDLEGVANE